MAEYLIYFNQQWVGEHSEEWFRSRGPLAMGVVQEMKDAGHTDNRVREQTMAAAMEYIWQGYKPSGR